MLWKPNSISVMRKWHCLVSSGSLHVFGWGGVGWGGGVSEEGTRHPRKIGHSEVRGGCKGAVREQTNENL